MAVISTNEIVLGYKVVGQQELQRLASSLNTVSDSEQKALDEMRKVNSELKKTSTNSKQAADDIGKIKGSTDSLSSSLKGIGGLMAAAFSVAAIKQFASVVTETTIKFQGYNQAIKFASGSNEAFAKNQAFLNELISKYGLDLQKTTEAYKSFFAAATLAGQAQAETNRQFKAVTQAGTVLKLTTDQMQGAFLALGQMMSKGTVQAEELRGQLGERIPGAFSIMAKALKVNEQQLGKMLEQGQVLSKTALPAFAAELEKTFGKASENNLNGMVNAQNRFNSAIDGLILAVGNKLEPFLKGAYDLAAGIANQLSGITDKAKQETVENIALKKTESDIAKKILDISIEQGVWVDRRKAATELLLLIDRDIELQLSENAKLRVGQTARDKINLANGEKKLEVLKEEERLLTDIAGVVITGGQKTKQLTEEEIKALNDQYNAKIKILEVDKKISDIRIELATEEGPERDLALLRNAEVFGRKRLQLDQTFANLGLEVARENARLQVLIVRKQTDDIIVEIKRQAKAGADQTAEAKNQLQKLKEEYEKSDAQLIEIQKKSVQKRREINRKANDEELQSTKEFTAKKQAIKQSDAEFDASQDEITKDEYAATAMALGQISDMISTRRIDNINREFNAFQRQYAEEVRLADGNVQKLTELNEKRIAKEKELREKEFRAQQQNAIAQVIFKTAPIIAEYFASGVLAPAAIAALAVQAAQIGFILSQPVPEFYKGVENFEGGLAKVGERGSELIETKNGTFLSPDKPTLTYLPKGTNVITATKTKERMQMLNSSYRNGQDRFQAVDVTPIAEQISRIPISINNLDERGFTEYVRKGNRTTQILNKRKGL